MTAWWSQALALCSLLGLLMSSALCGFVHWNVQAQALVMTAAWVAAGLIVLARTYLRGPQPPEDPLLAQWHADVKAFR